MKFSRFVFVAMCALAIIIASCSKDDSTPVTPATAKASDYFMPMKTGNFIMLIGTTTTQIGTLPPIVSTDTTTYTLLATTKTSIGGKPLRGMQTDNMDGDPELGYVFAGDAELMLFDSTLQEANASTLLKMPIQIGVPWRVMPNDTTLFVIKSTSETVTTPAGTFTNCLKISQHEADGTGAFTDINFFLAKGVGIVRMTIDAQSQFGTQKMTIKSDDLLNKKNF